MEEVRTLGWEGAWVAGTPWTSLVRRILTVRFRLPSAEPAIEPARSQAAASQVGAADTELKLASEPQALDRLVGVQPDSIAIVFEPEQPPRLSFPGEMLKPSLFPTLRPLQVLVVNTGAVSLDVTVGPLFTVDGHAVESAKIRVVVQLNPHDRYAGLGELAADHGTDLEGYLLQRVQNEVAHEVHAAVRMNRLADLRRQSLQQVLADRWMPKAFAGGVLLRREFSVLDATWPEVSQRPAPTGDSADRSDRAIEERRPETRRTGSLDLTVDARLRKLWAEHCETALRGIAGAKVNNTSTVIAVPTREPGAYEGSRLREAFGRFFDDRGVRVVAAVAESYDEIVRAWFKQVDGSPGRLVSVQVVDREGTLRIGVDSDLRSSQEQTHGVSVGSPSDREALRRLLPHHQVEFVAADTSG